MSTLGSSSYTPLEPSIAGQVAGLAEFQGLHFQVEEFLKGSDVSPYYDRFSILVPFCLERLRWQVLFNSLRPSDPPDIIFGSSDNTFHPLLMDFSAPSTKSEAENKISSGSGRLEKSTQGNNNKLGGGGWNLLRTWDVHDRTRLLKLILSLRVLYAQHQRLRAETVDDPQVRFELSTIGQLQGLEVFVAESSGQVQEVQMVLPIDEINLRPLAKFPAFRPLVLSGQPGSPLIAPQPIFLQIRFPVGSGRLTQGSGSTPGRPQVSVDAPLLLLQLVNVAPSTLPPWTDSMCTAAYLPEIRHYINDQILQESSLMDGRIEYLSALSRVFGVPLETDSTFFRRASHFVTCSGFTFIVHLSLPLQFPKIQPAITLQSSQHFDGLGRPLFSVAYSTFPWSPRWSATEMAQRSWSFVVEESANFKRQCLEGIRR